MQNFGYRQDLAAEHTEKVLKSLPTVFQVAGSHLEGSGEGKTVVLHDFTKKVLGNFAPSQNQPRGTCTSRGAKRAVEHVQGVQIALGTSNLEWKFISHAYIYGTGREIAGMLGGNPNNSNDDGCTGSAMAKAVSTMGNLFLTENNDDPNSDTLACNWGAKGVPQNYKDMGKDNLIKTITLAKNANDVRDFIVNGYACTVASDQGFSMERNSEGFCRASGSWSHQMCVSGYRDDKDWFLIDQSWGPGNPSGPIGSIEIPTYSFWIDRQTMERMVRQQDTWAFSNFEGWPGQDLIDWTP